MRINSFCEALQSGSTRVASVRRVIAQNLDLLLEQARKNLDRIEGYKDYEHVILKFENLQSDFDALMTKLGQAPIELPLTKPGKREARDPLLYFNPEYIARIRAELPDVFAAFGYSLPTA